MARVLVIEDDTQVSDVVRRILIRFGHEVDVAEGGRAGMLAFESDPPDVVITDINMPSMDGIEVIREVRALGRDVPVIAISGGGLMPKELLLANAAALGAVEVLRKPFEASELLDRIDRALTVGQAG